MTVVWSTDIPLAEKMVLLSLADNANDQGVCWPSISTIKRKCSLTDRAVQKCISKLRDRGLLMLTPRAGHSNVFTLTLGFAMGEGTYMIGDERQPLIHTPEPRSPPPPNKGRGTPEPRSPRIIKESSFEPSEIFRMLLKTSGKEPERTERLQGAIDAIGGWTKIRDCKQNDLAAATQAFCEAYEVLG